MKALVPILLFGFPISATTTTFPRASISSVLLQLPFPSPIPLSPVSHVLPILLIHRKFSPRPSQDLSSDTIVIFLIRNNSDMQT